MLTTTNNPRDLGSISFGTPYNFTYILKNEGNESVEINSLVVDCGACTKAGMNKSILSSGDEGIVEVTFTPGSTGINRKAVRVYWTPSGGSQKELKLVFHGDVT